MAALEKLEYPASGAVTHTWNPSLDAQMTASGEANSMGIVSEQSAGAQQYRYSEGAQRRIYKRNFVRLSDTDKSNFLTFVNVVLGATMKFTDYLSGTHTVSFENYNFEFRNEEGTRWSWEILLREEI